jgi:hypothetical protein
MLRRIVSLGQRAEEGRAETDDMSPSPGDDAQPQQETKPSGGLASVLKTLTGGVKSSKSTAKTQDLPTSTNLDERPSHSSTSNGLPPNFMEALEQLRGGSSFSERVAAAQLLRLAVIDYPLNPVLDVWYAAKDMVDPGNPGTARVAGWELLAACVKHASSTDLERKEYFMTITALANPDDFRLQLKALIELTNHGRNLSGFEYEVYPLVTNWLEMRFDAAKMARKQASRTKGKGNAPQEDLDFANLFAYVMDLIKFNFSVMSDEAAQALIDALISICLNTSGTDDLRACIDVMGAIITFGAIPNGKLKDCVQVLSSVYCLVTTLQKEAWHALSMLCRSHYGHAVVRILLNALRETDNDTEQSKEGTRNIRGALAVLQKLVSKSTEKGYPPVAYGLLVDGLATVINSITAWKIHLDVLRLINALFDGPKGQMNPMIVDEDWTAMFDVANTCVKTHLSSTTNEEVVSSSSSSESSDSVQATMGKEVATLISFLETVLVAQASALLQRQSCIIFFSKINKILPDSAATLVLDYFKEFRCCYPSDLDWEENLRLVLDVLFANRTRSSQLRVQALRVVTEVYDMVELVNDQLEPDFVPKLVKSILRDVAEESDIDVLQDIVSFTVGIAVSGDHPLFHYIVDTLWGILTVDRLRTPSVPASTPPGEAAHMEQAVTQSPSDVVAKGYVRIFVHVMHTDTIKAIRVFSLLVSMVKSNSTQSDARLTAMKLLFRLRADWANRVYITTFTETEHLAASLYRTEESLNKRLAEEAAQPVRLSRGEAGSGRGPRGVSVGHGQAQDRTIAERGSIARASMRGFAPGYQQLWSASDLDVLPDRASRLASSVLSSVQKSERIPDVTTEELTSEAAEASASIPEDTEKKGQTQVAALPTSEWLDAIISLLQGCDWEVQSYILVYLPSQLSNHALFKGAIDQIQELRRVVCELFRTNGFREPPSATGLRRADVAICLFHALTMILSYHQHFQKTEEDEIVATFVRGIAAYERTAKCCIHALSICCYELPLSTSKALVTILQKMSQIITQPSIAMHILEFLACLARRPSLYSNFREDEYRIVFGICFRYLQYVRDKKRSSRVGSIASDHQAMLPGLHGSQTHPSASDDLPQYVYALAYHVITFWFLALKLPDRAKHVGWIVKSLFTDVDGSEVTEEQAQVTVDFMQRVTYANVGESADDPLFTPERYGEIVRRRWLIGNSVFTVEQATSSGWAQITKRQPSGTSSYMIRETLLQPPAHQEHTTNEMMGADGHREPSDNVLPSHLLVQVLSALPQCTDQARPIPLPDDDSVNRALRMFDHSSTVDGHKVGIIYIGEDQTDEVDILANVSGSREYVEFLNGIGTLTKLKGATFNTQGLDRQYESDGEFAICWRDRVTELVFHVTTQMPTNLERDPQCALKKRHIGNDFVNIIFNDSGLPFKFDTFPSDFNFVNIVITPESRASFVATRQRAPMGVRESFYNVQVMSKPGFPEISPASDMKIVSLKALPDFIRLIALNASVFSLVWANREGGEHISSWRHRLREILRLRERYAPKGAGHSHGPSPSPPGTAFSGGALANALNVHGDLGRPGSTVRDSFSSLRRSSVATFFSNTSEQNTHSHRSSILSTAPTETTEVVHPNNCDTVVDKLDFSKWA